MIAFYSLPTNFITMKKSHRLVAVLLLLIISTASSAQKAMTYNIRYANPTDGDDVWETRRDGLAALIASSTPDVLGLQEVLVSQLEFLKIRLKGYTVIGVGRDDGASQGEFSPLFISNKRFSVLHQGWFWLSEIPELPGKGWDATCNRICTWAVIKEKNTKRSMLVLNTHLDHEGNIARKNSIDQLLMFINNQTNQLLNESKAEEIVSIPVILMGDFNLTPDDALYTQLKNSQLIVRDGLTDAYLTTASPATGPSNTFNGFKIDAEPDKRIDYVWSSGLEVKSYRTLDERLPNGRWPSDHLPVVVEFEVTE